MTAVVVDDEPPARRHLRRLLEATGRVTVVGEAGNVSEAAQLLELGADVVFLDIQMPGGSGFELFQRTHVEAAVVFVTAFDQHAVRAFEVNALDYLVKPVSPARLNQALDRLGEPPPSANTQRLAEGDLVSVRVRGGIRFVRVADVVCITASDDYSELRLEGGGSLLTPTPMRQWLERMPSSRFVRVHRSSIVNLSYLDAILRNDQGSYSATLRGLPEPLAISRRYLETLRERFQF